VDFRKAMIASGGLHVGILLAGLIALPSPKPNDVSIINSIPIDLVEISEEPQMAGARDGQRQETPQVRTAPTAQPQPRPEPVERARPVEAQAAPAPPPPPPPPPPRPVEAPPSPPTPPPRPVARPEPPQQVDPDGMRRLVEQQRQEQQRQEQQRQEQQRQEQARQERERVERERQQAEQRRREQQQRQQEEARRRQEEQRQRDAQRSFDANQIANLVNRQQGAPAPTGQRSEQTQRQASLGNPQGTGRRLTQSQTAALVGMIQEQIQPCWSPPVGRSDPGAIRVRIDIALNADGSVNGRPRIVNPVNSPDFRAVSESAVRAIMRCAPLRLPPDMYDAPNGWRAIEFNFDPSQMG
jgi:hypothetical protein